MSQTEIQSPPMPKPNKIKPVLFSGLILFFGIVIGAAATLIFVGPREKIAIAPLPEEFSRRMIEHLTKELVLTPQQQAAITPVMETHMKVLDEIRDEARPKIRQELDKMNTEIMSLLDANQKQIWNDRIKRMQENFSRSRQRRGPGRGSDDRKSDEQRPGPDGQEPRRFRERIPGQTPPLPEGQCRSDRPQPPQEPNLPTQ